MASFAFNINHSYMYTASDATEMFITNHDLLARKNKVLFNN